MERIADNLKAEVVKDILTLQIDLSKEGAVSKSGKSRVISSTRGNIAIPGKPDVKMGLNIYVPIAPGEETIKGA